MNIKNHSNNKVAQMVGQIANFKYEKGCFSTKYSLSYAKPRIWWQMVDDSNGYLKSLAIKLFSITPHSVTCERTFSVLGFLYGRRRQSLSLNTVEMMAKIRYYLLLNMKDELNHFMSETTEAELVDLVERCGFFDDYEEEENDESFLNNSNVEPLEILTHEVQVLIINRIVDLSNSIFIEGFKEVVNDDSSNDEDEGNENLKEELDFEIKNKISSPLNMQ